jgi:TPR repeat protein
MERGFVDLVPSWTMVCDLRFASAAADTPPPSLLAFVSISPFFIPAGTLVATSMSFNFSASAAPLSPGSLPAVTVAHAPQCQAQDEAAESHCNAVQAPEVADARIDDSSAALRASVPQHTIRRLSPQLCSVLLRSRSAGLMCASMAAQLQLPHARHDVLSALGCRGVCVYEVGVSGEERGRAMGGGGVGLLVLRMTTTGGACGRDLKLLIMSVVRHVAAVHAAATPEGAQLADMLLFGRPDVPIDRKRAFELASAGAGMGCAHSKGVLGCCYAYGRGVARDRAKGLELGRESAAAGSCMGQFVVGVCYDEGWGVPQDYAEAVRFWSLAVTQGHARAQVSLGNMFYAGHGVAQDYGEAVRFFRLAAEQGFALAQVWLGNTFYDGLGVAKDYGEAVRLYRLSAEQGNAQAQCNLGITPSPQSPSLKPQYPHPAPQTVDIIYSLLLPIQYSLHAVTVFADYLGHQHLTHKFFQRTR